MSFLLTQSIIIMFFVCFTNSIDTIFIYHPYLQVSGVFASAFGQFELPALDIKSIRVLL